MSSIELVLRDPLGERALSAADFPVSVGGPGHTVVLPGAGAGTLAWIALHDGQLFLQPVEGREPPLCNGAPVSRPAWLRAGDVIDVARGRLRVGARDGQRILDVEDGSAGNLTVPPEAPLVEVVSGGSEDGEERIEAVTFRRPETQAATDRRIAPRLLGGALVAVLVWATWFFATGHAVRIDVDPADSAVRMRGGLVLPVGGNHFARPGDYTVEIQRKGYEPLRAPVKVTDAPNQSVQYRLAKLPGILRVQAPVAARIIVAGKDVGSAPGEVRLPAGRHEILVTAPRYLPFKATVDIKGMEQAQSLAAKLVAAWAPVTVLTEPTGATVLVDGVARGVAPAKLELDAGTHRIELRQAGFKAWVTDVQVVADQPQTLGPVRLGLPDGTLVVRTDPAGASVSVGGAFRGRAPVTLDVRPDVALALVASREGYEPETTQLTVGAGERREVRLSLTPIFGEVTVMAEPASAEVFANGRAVGKSGQAHQVAGGPHRHRSAARGIPQLSHGRHAAPRLAAGAQRAARSGAGCNRHDPGCGCRDGRRGRGHRCGEWRSVGCRSAESRHADGPYQVRCRAATARSGELHDGQSASRVRSPRQRIAARSGTAAPLLPRGT